MPELSEPVDKNGKKIEPNIIAQNNLGKIAIEYAFMPNKIRNDFEFSA